MAHRHPKPTGCTATIAASFIACLPALAQEPARESAAFFEKHVRPVLVTRCYGCHSGPKTKGGLALDSRAGWIKGGDSGPAIVPGKPDESLLISAIHYESLEMPPKDKGGKLSDPEIAALTEWVKRGAFDPRAATERLGGMTTADARSWWAFQPLPRTARAAATAGIDAFIDVKLAAHALTPNSPADKRSLIRRATYDLTGLPPSPEEVDYFLADASPGAFARLVDRLLDSPQYGVHWGRRWLDVVRYADSAGENTDRPLPHVWRYRNWVFDSFNRDLPYDEFVRLQLAGDVLGAKKDAKGYAEGVVATGYLAVARRFGHDIDKDAYLMYEDVIDNFGKNFLGLSTGCARCHDHKYDPITSRDYYSLYGIFESTRFSFPGCEPKGLPRDLVPLLPASDAETLMRPWRERVSGLEAEKARRAAAVTPRQRLREMAAAARKVLSEAKVGEGGSVTLADAAGNPLTRIPIRKGEVLQLAVSPNGNHGADTTLVELVVTESRPKGRSWSVAELIPEFLRANPQEVGDSGTWCYLEVTNGPEFLAQRRESNGGSNWIRSWSLGDEPSVFVNASNRRVNAWTKLEPRSLFLHPGQNRPVAIAWVCPRDGEFNIAGRVADAHPADLDGVSFRLEHIASADFGTALTLAGRTLLAPLPDPGPEPRLPVAYAVVEGDTHDTRVQERGDPEKLGEVVPRHWLSVFGGELVPAGAGSGRKELAEWVVHHPLASRVMVNRIWQWHFGQGLVRTPNDFGSRGERPTHPALLDWLAVRFQESAFSIKAMHRLIMNSAAYQRSGTRTDSQITIDPDNLLLARFARRRLSAEEIRDSLLAAAGNLDLAPAQGHPFPDPSTWTFSQHAPFNAVYENSKRSAYQMVQRQRRHPFLALFDGADPNASTPQRQTTTVPTQALYFLNDRFFHAQAARIAASLMTLRDDDERVARVYRILFQRSPSTLEREQTARFLLAYPAPPAERWSALARVLLASNEFLYID
ncbi:MAG: PSD1 domain-containing protein [Planctomycetota bacterium]|nr:PSD1 domain-containing protein [Planctomycetota bacterium]